ncbi:hypothetical protein IAR55_001834 [Kwoniella newhampshirensis]|uniref:DUF7719 domain-containing protein n=1 Tax=Kwoniella newhampshirensis TaxID=1651941 RepID=A0AAW0Z3I1_9TREE
MARSESLSTEGTTSTARSRRGSRKKTKTNDSRSSAIPLVHPSTVRSTSNPPKSTLISNLDDPPANVRLSNTGHNEVLSDEEDDDEGEQEKTIDALKQSHKTLDEALEDEREDEIFNTLILTVPFAFLYILLDILVHLQYSHRPSWDLLLRHMVTAVLTNRHPDHFLTTSFLMAASIVSGCRLIWLVNKASWSVTTEQAPPMGTLWILTIVQLPLNRAVIALFVVGGWCWYSGMKIAP